MSKSKTTPKPQPKQGGKRVAPPPGKKLSEPARKGGVPSPNPPLRRK